MTKPTPWERLWSEINDSMVVFGFAQAEATGRLLKEVRRAVVRYGEAVDPEGFDELGQPIEPEEEG